MFYSHISEAENPPHFCHSCAIVVCLFFFPKAKSSGASGMERYESEFLPSLVRMFLASVESYTNGGYILPLDMIFDRLIDG